MVFLFTHIYRVKYSVYSYGYVKQYKKDKEKLVGTLDPVEVASLQQSMLSRNNMNTRKRVERKFKGPVAARFYELVEQNEARNRTLGPNKQEINGAIIYRQLKREGYDIGNTTIREKWREYRESHQEVFIKQSYEYGERADFDFHQVKLVINGVVKTYHQATISCPKSNYIFIRLMPDETRKSVFTALIEFFRYCGGVFGEIVFDNMKPVVSTYGYKDKKILSDEMVKFATYYGFKINTTNGRKGNEKGHVENSGKLIRKEYFSFKYEFENEQELVDYIARELDSTNQNVIDSFNEETKLLLVL